MRIARLDVDEGFLDGLSIEFSTGLNVIIGARGVGKTSVIELLRFVLGAPWFTSDAQARGDQQVRSILGSGLAKVTLVDDRGTEVIVTRSCDSPASAGIADFRPVTVLAQNEIEAIGAQPVGRLSLVDRFSPTRPVQSRANQLVAELRSIERECHELHELVATLRVRLEAFQDTQLALDEAVARQQAALVEVEATREDQQQLEQLRIRSSELAAQREIVNAALAAITDHAETIRMLSTVRELPGWPAAAGGTDLLVEARGHLTRAQDQLTSANESVEMALGAVVDVQARVRDTQGQIEAEARSLRAKLDSLQTGLGAITRRVDELRDSAAQRDAIAQQSSETDARLVAAKGRRRVAYDGLELLRTERFESRARVADELSVALAPHVKLGVRRGAARAGVAASLIELLKGSGLHYNRPASQLAQGASPLELVELIEDGDPLTLSQLAGVALERAQSMISYLGGTDLSDLLVAPIDDAVDLWLWDNTDFKSAGELSIGQRCTAVLAVLLQGGSDVLIVDQPEDHLDNAFVTTTLVRSLRHRGADAQLIFASHNANIPVLGNADRIVYLDSDGRRGYVRHQGSLNEIASVQAIREVMEGGADAFRRRAEFYAGFEP